MRCSQNYGRFLVVGYTTAVFRGTNMGPKFWSVGIKRGLRSLYAAYTAHAAYVSSDWPGAGASV